MSAGSVRSAVRRRGLLLVGAAAMLWGTSGLTATVAYDHGIHPLTVSSWRMLIGALTLVALLPGGGQVARWSRKDLARLSVIGTGLAAYQACYFLAVQRAGVSVATLVTLGLAPVLVVVGERLLTRRPTSRAATAGIGLAIVGLLSLVGMPSRAAPDLLTGAAFAVGSAFGYAALTLSGGTLSVRLGAQRLTTAAFAVAAALLAPATASTVGLGLGDGRVVVALLYLGLVPTALAYRLFFAGLPRLAPSTAAMMVLIEPVVASVLAAMLIGERLSPVGWFGAAMLIAAVATVSVGDRPGRGDRRRSVAIREDR